MSPYQKFGMRPKYVQWVKAVMATSPRGLRPALLYSVPLTPQRPLQTHASTQDSWTLTGSLSRSLVGSLLLSPGAYMLWFMPCRVCFPSPVEVLQSNPTGLQSQIPWGFSVPSLGPQVGKPVVCPRTLLSARTSLV